MAKRKKQAKKTTARPRRPTSKTPSAHPVPTPAAVTDENLKAAAPVDEPAVRVAEPTVALVAIGMSAGGFESVTQLLDALPAHADLAMVLIQHLAPYHPSALPALLSGHAPVRVVEATDGMKVERGHLYVIPPNALIELADGTLRLLPRPSDHPMPIDFFLHSLAAIQGDRAVAVILSGTGSDGRIGIRAVKIAGGTVIVQSPETAKYDGMPRAAIETGLVDLVLPPADIGRALVQMAGDSYIRVSTPPGGPLPVTDAQLEEIFGLLRDVSGVDFAHYKQPTVKRRIQRRMALVHQGRVGDYIALLKAHPDEAAKLYQDILIHVTRFFREPASFQALSSLVLPRLLEGRKSDSPLRAWVAGCATGEEAYSLAMVLSDAVAESGREVPIQLFGTDVSENAVEFARQGTYPARIVEDIAPETLRRHFAKVDAGYRISKTIRDYCVFARQDLTRDPPFSKLDLILCRNVLIYMDASLQRKVMPVFHYALKPHGYLVLGQAETIGTQTDLFALVEKKHKIYRKKAVDQSMLAVPFTPHPVPRLPVVRPTQAEFANEGRLVQNEANRVMLDRFGPPGVLVNEDLDIIQFRGHTGHYLEPAPGDATLSLLKLAREGLLHPLRSAVQAARKTRKPVRKEALRVRSNGDWTEVDLEVIPLPGLPTLHFLIVFDRPRGGRGRVAASKVKAPLGERRRASHLEDELAATREYLQSIIQEVEAANEELQSANEEILSSNEELQSTNEELDTAKEELQSTNEELNTLNEELHARNEELTRVNSDLLNLLGRVQIAIVIVGSDLKIRRFTPMAEKMLNLIAADIGRPITQVNPNIECPDLGALILEVIDTVTPLEREVHDQDGHWFSLRIRPYKGLENRIDGAVIALVDVDSTKRHETEMSSARAYAEAVADSVGQPVVLLDRGFRVRRGNQAFWTMSGKTIEEADGSSVFDVGRGRWEIPSLQGLLERAIVERHVVEDVEIPGAPDSRNRILHLTVRFLDGAAGPDDSRILVVFDEVAGRRV